jgi:hypothetical protein
MRKTAEPEESSEEPNYHSYHALFSHFPNHEPGLDALEKTACAPFRKKST